MIHCDKLPNCLCGISTRQLELLLWRARSDSPTYSQVCTIFFIQLNNVNKFKNNVLPPCVNYFVTVWHNTGNPTTSHSGKPFEANIERNMSGLPVQSSSSNCVVLISHRQLGNDLFGTGRTTAQHVHKTLYKTVFDTYQKVDYSLRLGQHAV